MNRSNDSTPGMAKALIPLGALAVAAGCGGGGGSAALPPQPQPPAANAPDPAKHATATALLTIAIPARGPQSQSAKRAPRYISQGSAAIGVSVATAGVPNPVETVFPLPSPAPQATSTTLPVVAPIGTDTVTATIYDALPGGAKPPNVLSKGATTATIGTGSTKLAVEALGVAAGIELTAGGSPSFGVLQNHPLPQSTTLTATPVDADGYTIVGKLASAVPLTVPAGVSVSPAAVASAGPLTATYAASQSAPGGSITAGLPRDIAPNSTDNVTVAATQYLFVATSGIGFDAPGALSVIDPVARTVVATIALPKSGPFSIAAVAGCASGETVVVAPAFAAGAVTTGLTVAPPSASTAPLTTNLTSTIAPRAVSLLGASPSYFAGDPNCGLYSANDATLTRYSGFPAAVGRPVGATGWSANSSLAFAGGTLYGIGTTTANNPPFTTVTGKLQSVAVSGGAAQSLGTAFSGAFTGDFGMEVGGVDVYEMNTSCGTAFLTAVPGMQTSAAGSAPNDFAVAPNGTIYFMTGAVLGPNSAGRRLSPEDAQRYAAAQRSAAATLRPLLVVAKPPMVKLTGNAGAVTADGRFLAVGTSGSSTAAASVQVYAIPATPGATPSPLGAPIPLPSAQPVIGRLVFPR